MGEYASLFENSLVPMMLLDLGSATIIDANPAACEFYGYAREDMRGMPVAEIETMDPKEMQVLMQRQVSDPEESALVLQHRRADGAIRDVDVRLGMMPDRPTPTAYVIVNDVTGLRAAIRELDEHRQRLEGMLEERTRELEDSWAAHGGGPASEPPGRPGA